MDFEQLREMVGANNLFLKNVNLFLTLEKHEGKERLQVDIYYSERDDAEVHHFLEERDCDFSWFFNEAAQNFVLRIKGEREVSFISEKSLNYRDKENYPDDISYTSEGYSDDDDEFDENDGSLEFDDDPDNDKP